MKASDFRRRACKFLSNVATRAAFLTLGAETTPVRGRHR